jgi:hypothetical protein
VLLRLSYLALTNVVAFVQLLPMSDVDKDVEILALRHQLAVLQRQQATRLVMPLPRQAVIAVGDSVYLGRIENRIRHRNSLASSVEA